MVRVVKKIIFYIIAVFFLFSFSSAEDTNPICNSEPDYITDLKDFVYDVISDVYVGWSSKNQNSNWMIDDLKSKIKQKEKEFKDSWKCAGFYINDLFMNAIRLPFSLFVLLKNPDAVIRDYQTLWDLSDLIRDKYLSLCYKWFIYEELPKEKINDLKKAIQFYNNSNPLITFDIDFSKPGITYSDVYSFVYRLVNLHREILLKMWSDTFAGVKQYLNAEFLTTCWGRSAKKVTFPHWCWYFKNLKLNESLLKNLMAWYKECSFVKVNFWKELSKMNTRFWKSINSDIKRITDAYNRLKDTLNHLWWGLTAYEAQLASNYRWRSYKPWQWSINPFESKRLIFKTEQNLQNERKEFIEPFRKFWNNIIVYWKCIVNMFWWKKCVWSEISKSNFNSFIKEQFLSTIWGTVDQIITYQNLLTKEEIKMDPTPITRLFPILTYKVDQAICLIWDRNKKWTIIRLLWKSCENQCSNIGGICWYY
jgi:hypothetical protein